MSRGGIVTNRHYLAAFHNRHPWLAKLGRRFRWLGWLVYGWPVLGSAVVMVLAHVVLIPYVGVVHDRVPWAEGAAVPGWLVRNAPTTVPEAGVWAVGVGGLAAGVVWLRARAAAEAAKKWLPVASAGVRWGVKAFAWFYTLVIVGPTGMILLAGLVPLAWVADVWIARRHRAWMVRRLFAQFWREFPTVFAIVNGKTANIQSIDGAVESTVQDVAKGRPPLEHPGLAGPPEFRGWTAMVPVWRSPGRGLNALVKTLDEVAAQYPTVANTEGSIELMWPEEAEGPNNFASFATMKIVFRKPSGRGGWWPGRRNVKPGVDGRVEISDPAWVRWLTRSSDADERSEEGTSNDSDPTTRRVARAA